MPNESTACAERGFSAEPEVVFDTATDPDRVSRWLPEQLWRSEQPRRDADAGDLRARWDSGTGWSVALKVDPIEPGGAVLRMELAGDAPHEQLTELAEGSLIGLAREIADRFTAT